MPCGQVSLLFIRFISYITKLISVKCGTADLRYNSLQKLVSLCLKSVWQKLNLQKSEINIYTFLKGKNIDIFL